MSVAYRALKNFVFGTLVASSVVLIAQLSSGSAAANARGSQ